MGYSQKWYILESLLRPWTLWSHSLALEVQCWVGNRIASLTMTEILFENVLCIVAFWIVASDGSWLLEMVYGCIIGSRQYLHRQYGMPVMRCTSSSSCCQCSLSPSFVRLYWNLNLKLRYGSFKSVLLWVFSYTFKNLSPSFSVSAVFRKNADNAFDIRSTRGLNIWGADCW